MDFQYSEVFQKIYLLILSFKKKIFYLFILFILGSFISYPLAEFIIKDITCRDLPYINNSNKTELLECKFLLDIQNIHFQTVSNNLDIWFKGAIQYNSINIIYISTFAFSQYYSHYNTSLFYNLYIKIKIFIIDYFFPSIENINELILNNETLKHLCILNYNNLSIINKKNCVDYNYLPSNNYDLSLSKKLLVSFYTIKLLNLNERNNYQNGAPIIVYTKPLEVALLNLKLSVVFGFLFVLPYFIYIVIKEIEKIFIFSFKMSYKFVFIYSIIFVSTFILGIIISYFLIAPLFIYYLFKNSLYSGANATYSIYDFVSFVFLICIIFGFLFQFPVILFLITKMNIVSLKTLQYFRRHLYVLFIIIAGLITPPDVFTQLIVAIPMIIFYELSLLFIKIYQYN